MPSGHRKDLGESYGPLVRGNAYRVARPFEDYDGDTHPLGETWTFLGYSFLPYDDGLSLFVSTGEGQEWQIRLQHRPDAQSHIIEALNDYISLAA